jgi:hypothetical protein
MAFETIAQVLRRSTPTVFGVTSIEFDCSISEDHGLDVQLTEKPIEGVPGQTSIISDHAIVLPRQVTLVVIASNTPDRLLPFQITRHLRIWRQLRDMAARVEVVDIVTTLEVYTNMVLLRVGAPRNRETTNALEFTIVARKAEFSLVTGVTQELADAVSEIAAAEADLGAQGTQAQQIADLATMGVV